MHSLFRSVIVLATTYLAACSVPTRFNTVNVLGQGQFCFRARPEARLTSMVNTCPIFGGEPRNVNRVWQLDVLTNGNKPQWWDSNTDFLHSGRNCELPTVRTEVLKLTGKTPLSLRDVKTMWDYENGHRIQIRGTAHLENGDFEFYYEKFAITPIEPRTTLLSLFHLCGNSE